MTICAIILLALTSAAEGEFATETGGVEIVLPTGWHALEQPTNFFVQKRARNAEQGIALSAGSFRLDLTLEQYAAIGVAGMASGPEAAFEKVGNQVGIPKEEVERVVASKIGRQLMDSLKQASETMRFVLLNVNKEEITGATRFEIHSKMIVAQSGQTLYSRQFVLRGLSPQEIVQITYVGTSERILRQKDLAVGIRSKTTPSPVDDGVQTEVVTPARQGQTWENSLGMKFKPVGAVLFCIWETRVRDFQQFARETGYNATSNVYSFGRDKGWKSRGHSWENPGFMQTPDHPVCAVNWNDAKAFCKWLTDKERKAGILKAAQSYRLPTDDEWSLAVGRTKFPWGEDWKLSAIKGNYAGTEAKDADWAEEWPILPNWKDNFPRTSPVGSFPGNAAGLYDLGGNVWEWCEDWFRKEMNTEEARKNAAKLGDDGGGKTFRVLRGGAWTDANNFTLASGCRTRWRPAERVTNVGFRCVVEVSATD